MPTEPEAFFQPLTPRNSTPVQPPLGDSFLWPFKVPKWAEIGQIGLTIDWLPPQIHEINTPTIPQQPFPQPEFSSL